MCDNLPSSDTETNNCYSVPEKNVQYCKKD